MKKIIAFVFLLSPFMSMGQVVVVPKDTSKSAVQHQLLIRDMPTVMDGPLYVLDDKVVKKDQIDTSKIRNIEIVRGAEAAAIWGSRGVNGVYVYTSEKFAKKKAEAMTLPKLLGNDPFYVVDGVPAENMDRLNPDSIINVEILKYSNVLIYSQRAARPIVIITTIKGEKLSYEKELGQLSSKYLNYIQQKNGNDNDVVYLVDGELIKNPSKDYVVFLYDTINKNIKHISFKMTKDLHSGFYSIPMVIITTKK
ncbi:hypothetical protein [uncultured Mucilaginibacter sp.]|nr:hypothetical protein [uncultured Mucilaginibacter sp.]